MRGTQIRSDRLAAIVIAIAVFLFVLLPIGEYYLGPSQATLMKLQTPSDDEATTRNYFQLVREKNFDAIEKNLDPGLDDGNVQGTLTEIANIFPSEQPISTKVVGARVLHGDGYSKSDITLEYEFPHQWVLANMVLWKRPEGTYITAFNATRLPDSIENLNRFSFFGKGEAQYEVLALAILSLSISIYAFVLCLKSRIAKRKWIWLLVTLTGISSLGVNWTTGQINFTLIAFHIPTEGAFALLYQPWTIYVSIPVGAITFLMLRSHLVSPSGSIHSGVETT